MPCSASFCSTVPAIFDLVVQKSSTPARPIGARVRPVSPIVPPHASNPKGLHFVEAGPEVQGEGRNFT